MPEPSHEPRGAAIGHDLLKRIAAHGRVVLSGDGADPALLGSSSYALSLLTSGAWGRLAADLWHSLTRRQLPKIGLRAHLRSRRRRDNQHLPAWINPDLAARLDLAGRYERSQGVRPSAHRLRPEAWLSLTSTYWPHFFEANDPGATRLPVEHRYPYFDLRVLTYLLSIPPLPWCDHKEIVRSAMKGLLPEQVRQRPKSYVAGNPLRELLRREESSWVDRFEAVPELARYVVRKRIPSVFGESDDEEITTNLRPLSLNYWLRNRDVSSAETSDSNESLLVSV